MVRFIATDLDGTLLRDNKELPEEIFGLIEELCSLGILFAPASGRQYANLKKLFYPVWDKLVFICENGALVKYGDKTLFLDPIKDCYLKDSLDKIRAIPHLFPLLCGTENAYIEDDCEPFFSYSVEAYTHCKKVRNLNDVIGREDICKIAVFDELSAADHCIKTLPMRLPALRTILSGSDWCDVSSPTANKGEAVKFIRKKFKLEKSECVAFGDHMNDYEMLLESGRPFVTENAYPPLKKLILRSVPSNEEGGVLKKIGEIIREKGEIV